MTSDEHQYRVFLQYFDQQVVANPTASALVFQNTGYSYTDLAQRASVIAEALRAQGATAGSKVAVGVERDEQLLPLLMGIWSLRAAYVPVDPAYPLSRQSYILSHAEADILVSSEPVAELDYNGRVIPLGSLYREHTSGAEHPRLAAQDAEGDDIAYIIYTSGSTGNPKGVPVTQANVHNFLHAMAEQPGLSAADRLLAVTTISFDIHVLELFLPLFVGAQIVLAGKNQSTSRAALQELIDSHRVTVMQATPVTWRMLLSHQWQPSTPLKILVGGEALPQDLRPVLHQATSELWNMYGPTETTVWSTCHKISPDDEKIYIGRPIRATTVAIVDEQLRPVADGSPGELLIGGAGVALGYYKSPELTRERFVELPQLAPGKLYRTGDAVIQHAGGLLEYVNRLDNQIKIRGFRIEPADIEHTLEQHSAVAQAVVVASNFGEQDTRLIAFYLGQAAQSGELLKHCTEFLPSHMLPQHVVQLQEWPMTANLKVDRKQLATDGPELVDAAVTGTQEQSASRDDLDLSLIAVWERNLGVKNIGLDDSFFDLGGHSLLALQTTKDMCVATGFEFPETILFESPTIRSARERMGGQAERAASVMKLNDAKEGDPVFCLCGVQIYQNLADQFAGERPVFSVFAKKELDLIDAQKAQSKISIDFDSLVQTYVDAIKRQGDMNKLTLVGLSFGGLIALEAAKRFRKEGVQVDNVVLLDTYIQSSSYLSLRKLLNDMLQQLRQAGFHSLRRDLSRRIRKQVNRRKRKALRYFNAQEAEGQREKAFESAASYFDATRKRYPFDALLIKASRTEFGFGRRPRSDYGLRKIIQGDLAIQSVAALHTAMLSEQSASEVYEVIMKYINMRQQG